MWHSLVDEPHFRDCIQPAASGTDAKQSMAVLCAASYLWVVGSGSTSSETSQRRRLKTSATSRTSTRSSPSPTRPSPTTCRGGRRTWARTSRRYAMHSRGQLHNLRQSAQSPPPSWIPRFACISTVKNRCASHVQAQPIVAAGYPQIYIYCINHTGKRLFFSLDGVKYNIVPTHGVNRQAAFGHEVWSVVAEDGTPLLQVEFCTHPHPPVHPS